MSRAFATATFLLVSLAFLLPAGDFWKQTKAEDWTGEEIQKIMLDSPWAKRCELILGMTNRSAYNIPDSNAGRRRGRIGDLTSAGNPDASSGWTNVGGQRSPNYRADTKPVQLMWVTALPVRQAIARQRFGPEWRKSPAAESFLTRPAGGYVLEVNGIPERAFGGEIGALKEMATLHIKGCGPIHPAEIQGKLQGTYANVLIFFADSGEKGHKITLEDKEVEVVIAFPNHNLKKKFKLADMVYEGRLEI
jgi:hypothetical protein